MADKKDAIDIEQLEFPSDSLTLGQIRKALGPEAYSDQRTILGFIAGIRSEERSFARNAIDEVMGDDDTRRLSKSFKDGAAKRLTADYEKLGIGENQTEQLLRDLARDAVALIPGHKK